MSNQWTPAEKQLAVENRADKTNREIADLLVSKGYSKTPKAVAKFFERLGIKKTDTSVEVKPEVQTTPSVKPGLKTTWGEPLLVRKRNIEFGSNQKVVPIAILPDIHAPFHDPKAIELTCKILEIIKPKALIYLGDNVDWTQLSAFDTRPDRLIGAQEEVDEFHKVDRQIVSAIGSDIKRYWILGNHELRLFKYLCSSPKIAKFRGLQLDAVLGTDKNYKVLNNVQIVEEEINWRNRFIFKHGNAVRTYSGWSARAELDKEHINGISGHCFDDQTEILTLEGWKHHYDLSKSDLVMTLNLESNNLEWNKINEIFKYSDKKELIKIKARDIDLMVTPEHGLLKVTKKNRNIHKNTAKELYGKNLIFPATGVNKSEGIDLSDGLIKFLAWTLAEGHVATRYGNGVDSIRIAQSNAPDDRLDILKNDLTDAGLDFSCNKRYSANTVEHGQYRNFDAYRINIKNARKAWDKIKHYINESKDINNNLLLMSNHQAKLFIDTWIVADGSINKSAKNSSQIASKRKDHVDFLQGLCAINGYRTSVSNSNNMYYLTINTRPYVYANKNSWSTMNSYDGISWCVSVDNGTLLVRRGGKTVITQNTHRSGPYYLTHRDKTLVWIEGGCLCRLDPEYTKNPNWQQAINIGYFNADGQSDYFHIDQIVYSNYQAIVNGNYVSV
jgi:hypothetical protein